MRGQTWGIIPVARWDPLSKTQFVEAVRQALTAAHHPGQDYILQAIVLGMGQQPWQLWLDLKTLGRWKSVSYQLYIRMYPHQLATLFSSLSTCNI